MSDRKQRNLPKLPSSWRWVSVGEITEVVRGASPRPKGDPRYFGGDIPWIMIADVTRQPGKYLYKTREGVTKAGAELSRLIRAGELILTNSGTVCVPKILKVDGCIHDGFVAFPTLQKNADLSFAYYWFEYVRPTMIQENRQGITQVNLNTSIVRDMHFPLPPLPEQRRIVAEIEKQFSRLEEGVGALRRVQANLKRYRAAVLKAACEGQLAPTEAELARSKKRKYETGEELLARILAERRQNWQGRGNYKEPAAPDTSKLGKLPEGWAWATFEQIAERVTVGFVGSMKHEYVENGVPFLRGQNVRENRFDPDGLLHVGNEFHRKLSKSALRPGDLAIVRSGSVGVTCVIPDSLPDSNCSDLVLVQRPRGFIPQYGAYYMNSLAKRHIAAGKVGVALIHFNTKSVAALDVPLPPLAEQKRIVAEVERRLSVVEEMEATVEANLQRATRLRQSILQKAFKGTLLQSKNSGE